MLLHLLKKTFWPIRETCPLGVPADPPATGGYVDLHAHILPGLDDGPATLEQALRMARIAAKSGTRVIVATPHCLTGVYTNGRDKILAACRELNDSLARSRVPLLVLPGAEVRLNPSIMSALARHELMTVNDGGRYLLLELPDQVVPEQVTGLIAQLKARNLEPIIAHPERNHALLHHPEWVERFVSAGALLRKTFSSCGSLRLRRNTTHTSGPGSLPRTATTRRRAKRASMGPFSPSLTRRFRQAPFGNCAASLSTRIGGGVPATSRLREAGRPRPLEGGTSVSGHSSQTSVETGTSAR